MDLRYCRRYSGSRVGMLSYSPTFIHFRKQDAGDGHPNAASPSDRIERSQGESAEGQGRSRRPSCQNAHGSGEANRCSGATYSSRCATAAESSNKFGTDPRQRAFGLPFARNASAGMVNRFATDDAR